MYDPVFNAYFSLDNGGPADGRWWGGDPIWNTIQRHGKRTNVMFWPVRALTVLRGIGLRDCVEAVCGGDWQGAEAEINGTRPTVYLPFVFSYPYEKRIQNILDWMALPEHSAPDLVLTYFDATDTEGHEYGPGSPQVVAAAQTLDAMVGMLMAGIRDLGAENHTNVIIVADHGMATITANRTIFLDDYIDMSTVGGIWFETCGVLLCCSDSVLKTLQIQVIDWSPNVAILPRAPTTAKDVVNALSGVHPNLTVLLKEDIPDRFHYQSNRRITPVLGLADLGWSITTHAGFMWVTSPLFISGDSVFCFSVILFCGGGPETTGA
jgi:predicted AlkP superfamily pyrophosphatase or phosphodiesterase